MKSTSQVLSATSGGSLPAARSDGALSTGRRKLIDTLLKTILAFNLTIPVVLLTWSDAPVSERTQQFISIVLATLVQAIAYPDFFKPAISVLVYSHVLEMGMLVAISITVAHGYSVVAFGLTIAGKDIETKSFFKTSTLLISLVLFGRLLAG